MKVRSHLKPLLFAILAMTGVGLCGAAETPAGAAKSATKAAAAVSPESQKLIDQFNAQRDTVIADRQALIDQLKNATAEQRKAILEKMQAQQKDLLDAQRTLGKQMRDELRKLRQSQPASGGR